MRFALISLEEPANGADGSLRVAGKAIYRWQAAMALACECERVLCWTPREIAAPLALQKEVEGTGSRFQPVGDLHRLARIVGPGDELLVFSPGLMVDETRLADFIAEGPGVATIPAQDGGESGFDRIDLTRLAAGLMFLPGNLVARLAELPDDCEPGGSLLRIALQSGVSMRPMAIGGNGEGVYRIVRHEDDAAAIEQGWFERDWAASSGPRRRLSRVVTDFLGRRSVHDARAPAFALGALALGSLSAAVLAVGGYAAASFGAAIVAVLGGETYRRLRSVARGPAKPARRRFAGWPGVVIDILLAGLIAMALDGADVSAADRVFLAVTLVLAIRLADREWGAALADRPVVAVILAVGSATGFLLPTIQLLVLLALVLALHFGTRTREITAD